MDVLFSGTHCSGRQRIETISTNEDKTFIYLQRNEVNNTANTSIAFEVLDPQKFTLILEQVFEIQRCQTQSHCD